VLDQIGQLLNADYFVPGSLPAVNFSADFTVGGFDIDAGAFRLSWDDARDRALLQVNAVADLGPFALSGDITVAIPTGRGDDVEVSFDNGSFVLSAGGVKMSASGIDGGMVLSSAGVAGVLRLGSLDLTQEDGTALQGLDVAAIRSAHLGFNTTGRAVDTQVGAFAFDYSADQHHDFFSVSADLDLGLSFGGVSYELGGRFGISREQMTIVQGQPQQGWVLSAFDAHTALTVGSPPGGAKRWP
jgi:hypothetical protein